MAKSLIFCPHLDLMFKTLRCAEPHKTYSICLHHAWKPDVICFWSVAHANPFRLIFIKTQKRQSVVGYYMININFPIVSIGSLDKRNSIIAFLQIFFISMFDCFNLKLRCRSQTIAGKNLSYFFI